MIERQLYNRSTGLVFSLLAASFIVLAAVLFAPGDASAQEPVPPARTLEGRLVNGTEAALPPVGLTVTLHEQAGERYEERDVQTDAEGRFTFDNIPFDSAALYGVTARYRGVVYGMDVDLSPETIEPITIDIYETTEDVEILQVTMSSTFYSQADHIGQRVFALEIVRVANKTDRTFVPGPDPMDLMRFALPEGADDLQLDTELVAADAFQVDLGFALTASVPPGEHEVMFAYNFPYEGDSVIVEKSFLFGAGDMRILAPYELGVLSTPEFGPAEDITIGETHYQLVHMADVPRSSRFEVALQELPQASAGERFNAWVRGLPMEYVAPAALAVLLVGLVGFAVVKRRGAQLNASEAAGDGSIEMFEDERTELARAIADLDERFENGKLGERAYHERREALSMQLAAVVKSDA